MPGPRGQQQQLTRLKQFKQYRPDMELSLCPLNCAAAPLRKRLSVTLREPYTGSNCFKYYSYGYVRRDDWLMWIADACHAKLKIWCPFEVNDEE